MLISKRYEIARIARAAKRRSVIGFVAENLRRALSRWRLTVNYKQRRGMRQEKQFVNEMVLKAKQRYQTSRTV